MLEKVIENWTSRLDYIRASRGSPLPEIIFKIFQGAVGSLVVRASNSRAEGLGSTNDDTKYTRNKCSLNQWVQKSCGLNHECRGLENIYLTVSRMPKLWRWRSVVSPSIVPSGIFAELIRTVICMVLKVNDRRTSSPLPR
ncbi:hypothetical protein TNCV_1120141 [Trichonephila clavipes]|uniref:Uncharacterized protein n=1 Tax=Trichonephila clavipes TaxID=2585209 RepID=A0A8X6VT18_TRICX|nr:hypothetical protein TNCV_1120141 [Trichonephila clavipes]